MHNRYGKKLTEKNLNVNKQFFKDVLYVTLLQEEVGQYQFLEKLPSISPFPLINTSSQMKIFIYSTYPFHYNPRPCLATVLLINKIYSWKSILKHMDVDITCLTKSSLTKHKNYLLQTPYRTSETSKLELLTKKVNGL